jgi:hypothetical protein
MHGSLLTYTGEAEVPEPSSPPLVGTGLVALSVARRRKQA